MFQNRDFYDLITINFNKKVKLFFRETKIINIQYEFSLKHIHYL